MRATLIAVIALALVAGGFYYVLSPQKAGDELGKGVPAAVAVTQIREITANAQAFKGREVTVSGNVVELCPTTGHWGYLDDGTGRIRWDSGNSGWVTPKNWQGKRVSVQGTVVVNDEGSPEIAALGAKQ